MKIEVAADQGKQEKSWRIPRRGEGREENNKSITITK
jgi:hypothetical protein